MLHDEHVVEVGAEGNALGFEGLDDADAQLAEDTVFLVGTDADGDGVDDLAAFDLINAGDVGVGDDDLFEGGIVADFEGNFF